MESPKWWWIGNHNTTSFSAWLHSSISCVLTSLIYFDMVNFFGFSIEELDEKTKEMLRVIDEDADTFAARAEMYYKKRPELVAMVEDFYRSHRSLAERHDLLRPSSVHKHGSENHHKTCNESSCSDSKSCETHDHYAESEVDDGENKWLDEGESSPVDYGEANENYQMMKEEMERLREENSFTVKW
ncbi:unnamed protein product [Brassica oleracea]